jgi:methylmalonyl-CoA mutase N-terminal domain/subunit
VERAQIERLAAYKSSRDSVATEAALARLKQAAGSDDNLMPHILNAVEAAATLGEIAHGLRSVFGVYQERVVI